MKSPMRFFSLIFLGMTSLVLFSCTRAAEEKTSITITLPNSQALKRFSTNLTTLSMAAETSTEIAPVLNDYAPEPADLTEYETNCFLVAVSYPEEAANRNYCGTKTVETGETIDDTAVSNAFKFSQNFVGLVGPGTTTIELTDVVIGPGRTFTVIAVPTTDPSSCQDLLSQPLEKGSMLKPRKVGSVTQDVRVNGDPINLVIDTTNPTANYDDCVITDTKLNYPNADKMVIDQESFPFNYMRKASTGYICQPINVSLLANLTGVQRDVPGALNFDSSVSVGRRSTGTTYQLISTFNTHQNCKANNNPVDSFIFPRNKPTKMRWIQVPLSAGVSSDYLAYSNEAEPEVRNFVPARFIFGSATSVLLDHDIPRVLQLDVCYKASTIIRRITGMGAGGVGQSLSLTNAGTQGLQFFDTGLDCENDVPMASVDIASGGFGKEYWIKAPSGTSPNGFSSGALIEFYLTYGTTDPTGTTFLPYTPRITIYTSAQTQGAQLSASGTNALTIDQLGYVSAYPKIEIPNISGGCYPVTVNINNRLGAVFASNPGHLDFDFILKTGTTLERFENVALRYQPIDLANDGDVGGYTINYGGNVVNNPNPCQYSEIFPVGSASGTTMVMTNSSGTGYTFFIQTTGQGGVGRRRIQLYYGGTSDDTTIGYPVGQVDFVLTTPD